MTKNTKAILNNARLLEYIKRAKCVMHRFDMQDDIERLNKDEAVEIVLAADYQLDYIVCGDTVKFGEIDFDYDSDIRSGRSCGRI
jgi:hypothetical protein